MGIEPYLIATSVNGIIAQRLVRKNCPRCTEEYTASDYEKEILGVTDRDVVLKKGKGCPYCNNSGYKGRVGIYEILQIDRNIRDGITAGKTSDAIRDIAVKSGMKTLRKACTEHVLEGITSIDELMRVAFLKE